MQHRLLGIALCSLAAFASSPARAEAPDDDSSGWQLSFTPYAWLTALDGSLRAGDAEADVDASISDVLSNVNVVGMGEFEVQHGRFLATLDLFYAQLEDDAESGVAQRPFGPATIQQGPVAIQIPRVTASVGPLDVNAQLEQTIADLKLGYRALDVPLMANPEDGDGRRFTIDLFAGVRYMRVKNEIDVELGPVGIPGFTIQPGIPAFPRLELPGVELGDVSFGGVDETFTERLDWFDPLVGVRVRADLTDSLSVGAQADFGGFGSGSGDGSASEYTGMAQAGLGYRATESLTLMLGYRVLEVEREHMNLIMHGPVIGGAIRF